MIIEGNRQTLEQRAARLLAEGLNQRLGTRPQASFGVVGGRSVGGILELLGRQQVEWGRVHLFMADERLVALDHPDSNYRLVHPRVSSYMVPGNLHPFVCRPGEERSALRGYREELERAGGRLDAVLLSSGEDGHIASLFPEHETVDSPEDFFITTSTAPKPPPLRMSAAPKLLAGASTAVLLFFGAGKQQALIDFMDDAVPLRRCPAKIVKAIDRHFILTDRDGEVS